MIKYKHTQIGYLMMVIALVILVLFARVYIMASVELTSVNSGPKLSIAAILVLVLFILASFVTLTTIVDDNYLRIKFGCGIFRKKFLLKEIISAKAVRNPWYYGRGIKVHFSPYMWIFSVSGFDAVEIVMKNGRVYRIGTDKPKELEEAIGKELTGK